MTERTAALDALDRAIADLGVTVWIGAEPTYTHRSSTAPVWLHRADSDDDDGRSKRAAGAAIAAALAAGSAGRAEPVAGRQFPDEPTPRFRFAVHADAIVSATALPVLPDAAAALLAAPLGPEPSSITLTVTPDPGVVEINTAPCATLVAFAQQVTAIDAAATAAGLSADRYRYNGDVVDSGGGGQLTVGGPSPEASPFFTHPALLPRLLRYVHNHPALSYWFLGECAGSASQSPRPDEGVRERADLLALACDELEHLAATDALTPELTWQTVAPILVDAAGNPHRAELNVEKLWNPTAPRGCLGLVEWRAFRMAPTPAALIAAAALVRAVTARCAVAPYQAPWHDWGSTLHHRWALPSELAADLAAVVADLAAHGLDLGPLTDDLASYREPALVAHAIHDTLAVEVHRAVEFWPLYGDVASQERATARTVDASTERVEVVITTALDAPAPRLVVGGRGVVLAAAAPGRYRVGVRRRRFVPMPGFLPSVPADEPLVLHVGDDTAAVTIELHAWRPGGGPYDGLPADRADADRRRAERAIITPLAGGLAWPRRIVTATDTVDARAWREEVS